MADKIANPSTAPPPSTDGELVYAAAILIMSQDLYSDKREIIREYIQNASDALDAFRPVAEFIGDLAEPKIKISFQGKSITIFDNGIGMDEEEIQKHKRIAYSEKKVGDEAGYKGIGRLAGIAVAKKLKVSSTAYGDPTLYTFEFRAAEMRKDISEKREAGVQETATEVINRHTSIGHTPVGKEAHYTMVELHEIDDSCEDLLDPEKVEEYVADVCPVDFAPLDQFAFGPTISQEIGEHVPNFRPKKILISKQKNQQNTIYRPFKDSMCLAEPKYFSIRDQESSGRLLAFVWYAPKGETILGKIRAKGRIFTVDDDPKQKKRYAGLIYKLFGFSIGDRSLPRRTLWTKTFPRSLWYTGEIHIVDNNVLPTTNRGDFIDNKARSKLYASARVIPTELNQLAQKISDNYSAYRKSKQALIELQKIKAKLDRKEIYDAEVGRLKQQLYEIRDELTRRIKKCSDEDIKKQVSSALKLRSELEEALKHMKDLKKDKTITTLPEELNMSTSARKVYNIIMNTLSTEVSDQDEYHRLAKKIITNLKRKY